MKEPDPFIAPEPARDFDLAAEIHRYWYLLKRRRWILLTTFVVVVLTTAIYSRYQVPVYRATATLMIEPDIPYLSDQGKVYSGDARTFYQSQYEIIRSFPVAKMTVQALGLGDDGEPGSTDQQAAITAFQAGIAVRPIEKSRLVKVSMDDIDPEGVADKVNTLVRMYIYRNLEDRRAASKDAFTFLSERLAILKAQVAKSENDLLEYKEKEDIVSLEKRQALVEERLSELTERHTEAALSRSELETLLGEARGIRAQPELAEAIPQIRGNAGLQQLNSSLMQLQLELGDLSRKYKPKHPRIIQVRSQIENVQSQREAEISKLIRSIEVEFRISQQTERGIQASLDDLKRQSRQLAQQAIQYGILQREAESNRQMYDVVLQRLKETDFSGNITINNIRVVEQARAPSTPLSPRPRRALRNAVLGSLLLGFLLCIAVDFFDSALKSENDVSVYLESPILGVVPKEKDFDHGSVVVWRAYSDIKTNLDFYGQEHVLRSLVITSAVAGEGKTTASICLGKMFAGGHRKVLLIDADLIRPILHRSFDIEPEAGLSDYFLHHKPLDEILAESGIPGLQVLPAGLIPPNPTEILGSQQMAELLDELKSRFDFIVVDTPPVSAGLEVAALSGRVDGVALVARAHATPRAVIERTLGKLHHFECNVVGIVLNGLDPASEDLDGGYGYDGYGYDGHGLESQQDRREHRGGRRLGLRPESGSHCFEDGLLSLGRRSLRSSCNRESGT